jgi:hypothetical protein
MAGIHLPAQEQDCTLVKGRTTCAADASYRSSNPRVSPYVVYFNMDESIRVCKR